MCTSTVSAIDAAIEMRGPKVSRAHPTTSSAVQDSIWRARSSSSSSSRCAWMVMESVYLSPGWCWLAVARSKAGKSDQLSRNSAVRTSDRQPALCGARHKIEGMDPPTPVLLAFYTCRQQIERQQNRLRTGFAGSDSVGGRID